jgi:hypothetical protein
MKFDQQWVFEKSTSFIGFHYFNKGIIYFERFDQFNNVVLSEPIQ